MTQVSRLQQNARVTSRAIDIVVRDAETADAAALIAILNPIIDARVYSALDTTFTLDAEREYLRSFPVRGVWKVAERMSDRRLLGFQVVEPFATYTAAFDHVGTLGTYVDLAFRRQGIARRLFEVTLAAARDKGYEKIFTFVRADNPAALAAYQTQGFRTVGTARKHARIDGRYIDEILIEKALEDDSRP